MNDLGLNEQEVATLVEHIQHEGMPQETWDSLLDFVHKRKAQLAGAPYATPGGMSEDIPSGPYWRCRIKLVDGSLRRIYYNMETFGGAIPRKWLYADRPKKAILIKKP